MARSVGSRPLWYETASSIFMSVELTIMALALPYCSLVLFRKAHIVVYLECSVNLSRKELYVFVGNLVHHGSHITYQLL